MRKEESINNFPKFWCQGLEIRMIIWFTDFQCCHLNTRNSKNPYHLIHQHFMKDRQEEWLQNGKGKNLWIKKPFESNAFSFMIRSLSHLSFLTSSSYRSKFEHRLAFGNCRTRSSLPSHLWYYRAGHKKKKRSGYCQGYSTNEQMLLKNL